MAGLIDGVIVHMGGRDWTVAPLTFKQLRRLQPQLERLAQVNAAAAPEQIAAVSEIVRTALSRNYPEITIEAIEDMLDLGNAARVINAILTGSGLSPGEGAPGKV